MNTDNITPNSPEVHRRWQAREAPGYDCVLFADGSLAVMELVRLGPPGGAEDPRDERWQWHECLRATSWTTRDWVDVDSVLASDVRDGHRALAGESAAHGSFGWVALTRDDAVRTLCWIAVCAWSDPFGQVVLDETAVTAVSTSGRTWAFPRSAPQDVRIGC
ncbi:hypothetical protein HUT18_33065 [Streptomyces sp. NA04227]|nr:hypothetical protein HUT18_33065 [Streptomyces sp. NA04227]